MRLVPARKEMQNGKAVYVPAGRWRRQLAPVDGKKAGSAGGGSLAKKM